MHRSAILSEDGLYRYELTRRWNLRGPRMCFIMLNPSTADAYQDDATIRRCISFARREACGEIIVINQYAYRATDPSALLALSEDERRGAEHRTYWNRALERADIIVAAWGNWMAGKLKTNPGFGGLAVHCLGTTKSGEPRHPLYLPADTPLERYL